MTTNPTTTAAIPTSRRSETERGVDDMPLDEAYFVWLYSQVGSVDLKNRSKTYWRLMQLLHNKEFTWDPKQMEKDGNRASDGKNLRQQFLRETNHRVAKSEEDWLHYGCSFFELLVALAWLLEFEDAGKTQAQWFWVLIDNIGLTECTDANPPDPIIIDHILNQVIDRSYATNGAGGLFPLQNADKDQRDVELWYQLNAYLLERL
jgi:hypothetical protein